MRGYDSVHLEKALSMSRGLEAPHPSFAFTRRLMRVLRPVIQIPMLPMSNTGHNDPLRGGVAAQLIGNDHTRFCSRTPQQFAKKPHGSKTVPLRLDKDVKNDSILIHSTPEIV